MSNDNTPDTGTVIAKIGSGLDTVTLTRIASDLKLPLRFAEMKTNAIVVDYIRANVEVLSVRLPGEPAIDPITLIPHQIIYTLEDQMFGGEVFIALVCEGNVIGRPVRWTTYEEFGKLIIDKNVK
jgi:hypothetical protein